MRRAPLGTIWIAGTVGLAGAIAQLGCAAAPPADAWVGPAAPQKVYASALARRLARVQVGQSAEEARAVIGTPLVRRPGSPVDTFPSPLRRVELQTPEGHAVEIELYVVSAVRAEGCPDVHTALAPVVYVDGEVAALDWDFVEASWRDWGGGLSALRELRGMHECLLVPPSASAKPGPPPPTSQP